MEIIFLVDGFGMFVCEGGGNNVMVNLFFFKFNEVYYWEVKMYDKLVNIEVVIGFVIKFYLLFRLFGWNKYFVVYFVLDGFKLYNYLFILVFYGFVLVEGDVLGVGYCFWIGIVFFICNGCKFEDVYIGL